MSKQTKNERAAQDADEKAAQKAAQAEVDAKAMDAARELRARRETARGPAPIDNEIHRSLPLTRAFVPLIILTLAAYGAAQFFIAQGNDKMAQVCTIAASVLFIVSFTVWFVSRHQAKKLTEERRKR